MEPYTAIAIVALILAAIFLIVGFSRMAYHKGNHDGLKEGFFKGVADTKRVALEAAVGQALAGNMPISIENFEKHCLSTVTSKLYGTPGWWTHICFKYAGENGEFMEHVGKASRDDGWSIFDGVSTLTPERRASLLKELGDELWYQVVIAKELGSNLGEIMLMNIEKREGRKARGTLKGAGDDR